MVGIFSQNIGLILFVDVIGAILAISFLSFVSFPPHIKKRVSRSISKVIAEMKEGLQTIRDQPALTWSFIYGILVVLFIVPMVTLLPLMATNHFGGGTQEMTYVEVAYSLGMMIGGLLLLFWKPKIHALMIVSFSLLFQGLGVFLSGLLPQQGIWIFVVILVLCGIVGSIQHAAVSAFYQIKVPQEKLGRVLSLNFSITVFPSLIGLLLLGSLTDSFGSVASFFVMTGTMLFMLGIFHFFTPQIQQAIKEDQHQKTEF